MTERIQHPEDLLEHRIELERLALVLAGDREAAADIVQETWLAALEHPPTDRSGLRWWLRTVARNAARKAYRRRVPLAPPEQCEQLTTPRHDPGRQELLHLIRHEASHLDEPYRTVIRMRFFDNELPAQISQRLGRSTNTVHSQIQRGLARIRKRLDRRTERACDNWVAAILAWKADTRGPLAGAKHATGMKDREVHPPKQRTGRVVAIAAAVLVASALLWSGTRQPVTMPLAPVAEVATPPVDDPAPSIRVDRVMESRESDDSPLSESPEVPPAVSPAGPLGSLNLRVVDQSDQPVEGASVLLQFPEPLGIRDRYETVAHTDADGRATVPLAAENQVLAPGIDDGKSYFGIGVDKSGFVHTGILYAPFEEGDQDVAIRISSDAVTVIGRVVDSDGEPIPDAVVCLGEPGTLDVPDHDPFRFRYVLRVFTDEEGYFEHDGLSPNQHRLSARQAGYLITRDTIQPRGRREIDFGDIVLHEGASIRGTVENPDGTPAVGADVVIRTGRIGMNRRIESSCTDQRGVFEVRGIAEGLAWVSVRSAEDPTLGVVEQLRFGPREEKGWSVELAKALRLRLRCRDELGNPLASLHLRLRSLQGTESFIARGSSDDTGLAVFENCPSSEFFVTVLTSSSAGLPLLEQKGLWCRDEEYELVIPSTPSATLKGSVQTGSTDLLDGAKMWLCGAGKLIWSPVAMAENGEFQAEGLRAGNYYLTVVTHSGAYTDYEVDLLPGETKDMSVPLPIPIDVNLHWQWPSDPGRYSFHLVSEPREPRPDGESYALPPFSLRAVAPPPTRLSLMPGPYVMQLLDEESVIGQRSFEVAASEANRFVFGPN